MKNLDVMMNELRGTEPYLDDNGFTAVVMAQLPARRELPMWAKNLILLTATLLGSAIVAMQFPADSLGTMLLSMLTMDLQPMLAAASQKLPLVLVACVVISYLVPCGALLAVRRNGI